MASKIYDVVVIGAGPTGVFSAEVLAESGLSVALICESNKGPKRQNYADYSFKIQYDHYAGFGGGTHLWANVCRPHDSSDFKNFSDKDLYPSQKAYLKAEKFLGVENGSIFWHSATQPKVSDKWIKQFSDKIEFLAFVYPRKIKKIKKSDFQTNPTSQITIFDNFFAKSIERCGDVFNVNVIGENNGKDNKIRSKRIMVCAGTVGSAALIKRSLICHELPIHSLSRKHVGCNIHEHFMFTLGRITFDNPISKLRSKNIGNEIAKFAFRFINYDDVNHTIYPLPALSGSSIYKSDQLRQLLINIQNQIKRNPWSLFKLLLYPNLLYQIIDEKILKAGKVATYDLWVVLQSNPNEDRKIEFTDDGDPAFIRLRFDQNDIENATDLQQKLRRHINNGNFVPSEIDKIIHNASVSAHLGGSLKQALLPGDGVVDRNFELHGCRGIYVGDASSIPVSGTSNITLTACANAWAASTNLISGFEK